MSLNQLIAKLIIDELQCDYETREEMDGIDAFKLTEEDKEYLETCVENSVDDDAITPDCITNEMISEISEYTGITFRYAKERMSDQTDDFVKIEMIRLYAEKFIKNSSIDTLTRIVKQYLISIVKKPIFDTIAHLLGKSSYCYCEACDDDSYAQGDGYEMIDGKYFIYYFCPGCNLKYKIPWAPKGIHYNWEPKGINYDWESTYDLVIDNGRICLQYDGDLIKFVLSLNFAKFREAVLETKDVVQTIKHFLDYFIEGHLIDERGIQGLRDDLVKNWLINGKYKLYRIFTRETHLFEINTINQPLTPFDPNA